MLDHAEEHVVWLFLKSLVVPVSGGADVGESAVDDGVVKEFLEFASIVSVDGFWCRPVAIDVVVRAVCFKAREGGCRSKVGLGDVLCVACTSVGVRLEIYVVLFRQWKRSNCVNVDVSTWCR